MSVSVRKELITKFLAGIGPFLRTYNVAVSACLGIVTIIIITLFFMNVVKFSASADNDARRRLAINGILICLVCLGFIGSIDVLYGILLSIIFGS